MAKPVRTKKQAARDKSALKKLRDLGIIRAFDARKKPTRGQLQKIKEYADVIAAKKVSQKTAGVPPRAGEKLFKTKDGKIIGIRKVGGRVVKSRFRKVKTPSEIEKPATPKTYAVPFIRGRDAFGKAILQWMRWNSWEGLREFMSRYEDPEASNYYKDWTEYVVEEELGASDDLLRDRLEKKMQKRAQAWSRKIRRKGKSFTRQQSSKSAGVPPSRKRKKSRRKKE